MRRYQFAGAGMMAVVMLAGCNGPQTHSSAPAATPAATAASYPPRPDVPPPAFKVFHHDASSITLVTKEDATDAEIESLIWELRDAAQAHGFDKLKGGQIAQKWVDARDPMMWFHIYRGTKCAPEKYAPGKLPCGASYHAAGDFTYGGFTNKEHVDGVLIHDETHETQLWNPDLP